MFKSNKSRLHLLKFFPSNVIIMMMRYTTLAYTIYTSRIFHNLICDKMRRIDFNQ